MKRVGGVSALGALVGLTASSCVGVAPPAAAPPAALAPSTQIAVAAKPDARVSAPPPVAEATALHTAAAAAAPAWREALTCLAPLDPEFDRESPWSRAVGQRLERELPMLARCTSELPSGSNERVTLRLLFDREGRPLSQHIVQSGSAACGAAQCIEQALSAVRAPKLAIEHGAFDLALILEAGAQPRRTADELAGLADDAADDDPNTCVDPAVARLSRATVDQVVRTTFEQLEGCYARAMTRDHEASGSVTFEFVIGREGEVVLAQARDATLYDCEAIECMVEPFRQLRFPAPLGRSVRVIYPIRYLIEQPPVQLR